MNRRRLGAFIGLAFAAVLTQWWLSHREDEPPNSELPDARSDYVLEDFSLTVMNETGQRRFHVRSPHLERSPVDDSASLQSPDVSFYEDNALSWSGTARRGWIDADGAELLLEGAVELTSHGDDQTVIETPSLTYLPDQQLARTDQAVKLTRPNLVITGVGMNARLDTKRWELLSDVKTRFQPGSE